MRFVPANISRGLVIRFNLIKTFSGTWYRILNVFRFSPIATVCVASFPLIPSRPGIINSVPTIRSFGLLILFALIKSAEDRKCVSIEVINKITKEYQNLKLEKIGSLESNLPFYSRSSYLHEVDIEK